MDEFSPTEVALEGLRLTRERPRAVLWWWGGYFLALMIQLALALSPPMRRVAELQPQMSAASNAVLSNPTDKLANAKLAGLVGQVEGWMLLFFIVVMLCQMVLSTAVLRAVMRPNEHAFGYLRLSMDEVRQLGLALLATLALLAYAFIVTSFTGILVAILSLVLPPLLVGALTFAVIVIAFLYPAVRLSLAPAMTLVDRRISFLRAWSLTKGRFWPLFGGYLIAFVISLAIWASAIIIFAIFGALAFRGEAAPPKQLNDLIQPVWVGAVLINSLFLALIGATVTAPLASAFRQLVGRGEAQGSGEAGPTPPGSPWGQP